MATETPERTMMSRHAPADQVRARVEQLMANRATTELTWQTRADLRELAAMIDAGLDEWNDWQAAE
jgi:hypothetical protein